MGLDWERLKKVDQAKSKVLKYIVYKKRTEYEVRKKFENEFDEDIFEEVIDVMKENKYLGDNIYAERSINEFIAINTLSIKEIKYKLQLKGIKSSIIDECIQDNYEELIEYEHKCAVKQMRKKLKDGDIQKARLFLMKKGYKEESIKYAIEELLEEIKKLDDEEE